MSIINSSALSLRNIATHFSSQLHSAQQACSAFVRNICRIAPSQETLNKQVNLKPATSELKQPLNNNIHAQTTPKKLFPNGEQFLLNNHLYEEPPSRQRASNEYQSSTDPLYEEIPFQQRASTEFHYSTDHLYDEADPQQRASTEFHYSTDHVYDEADPQQRAPNEFHYSTDHVYDEADPQQRAPNEFHYSTDHLYDEADPQQRASNRHQGLADDNIYEEISPQLPPANRFQPLLNNDLCEPVNPQQLDDNERNQQISGQISGQPQGGGKLKNILQQYFMKKLTPGQREMRLEMWESQQKLNDFFFLQKQKAKENVQRHSDIYNIVQAQIDAVNKKNKDCGFYLTLDGIHGVSMDPLSTHKATVPLDEKVYAKYEAMCMQRDSLNHLLFNETRKNHVISNSQSALMDIIDARVKSINSRLRDSGYQLTFNVKNGVTMVRLPAIDKN